MSIETLAQQTGEPTDALRGYQALGLITEVDADRFGPEALERVRLLQHLARRGINPEAVAHADEEQGGLLARFLEDLFPDGAWPTYYPVDEAANRIGLDVDVVRRLWDAAGMTEPGDVVTDEDLGALETLKLALDAGFPEDALLQLLRVYTDALDRVADAEARLFHFYVHERLRASGLTGSELVEATYATGDPLRELIEPAVLYFHRKGWARALREDLVLHITPGIAQPDGELVPGRLMATIAFVDLSSFTSLTDAMGDATAARVLERFSDVVRRTVSDFGGRIVKQIGDAFMLVFSDPRSAVACAHELEARAVDEPQFLALRLGLHCGPVLYREGDYLGINVNLAARVAAEAQPHQVLVTAALRQELGALDDVELVPLGTRQMKGIPDDVELFEARRAGAAAKRKMVDPVCGMELGPDEIAARLTVRGAERPFCSTECLRRFVAAPERYVR